MNRQQPSSTRTDTRCPYTTLFRSDDGGARHANLADPQFRHFQHVAQQSTFGAFLRRAGIAAMLLQQFLDAVAQGIFAATAAQHADQAAPEAAAIAVAITLVRVVHAALVRLTLDTGFLLTGFLLTGLLLSDFLLAGFLLAGFFLLTGFFLAAGRT